MLGLSDLNNGAIEVIGLLPWASNYSLLCRLTGLESEELVVYKPMRGESPLWDFPDGTLCRREVAAYAVSAGGGWDFVPPTVLREGPLGLGAVQAFVAHDPSITAFELIGDRDEELRLVALFDLATNNADRKAGHVLLDEGGRLWAVDHGICFHRELKLRTVLWDFAGQCFTSQETALLETMERELEGRLCDELEALLEPQEIEALRLRIKRLIATPRFPLPGPGRNYPWPPT